MKSQSAKRKLLWPLLAVVPASLAVAGALVYRRYRGDLKAARARIASGSRLVNTSSGLIEYADVGTGAPVLVIHGAGGGFDQGLEFARPLLDAGFRVIAPSRFGYLRTPLPADASPMAQADAHASLLDALQLEKVAVVGVSAGAPSAMQLCLRHPGRCTALVLTVPLVYSGAPAGPHPSALREFLINTAISSDFIFWTMSKLARNTMFRTVLGTPPKDVEHAAAEEQARVIEVLDHIEPVSRRKKGLQNETAVARSLPRYDLEHLQVPTLVSSIEDCLYNTYPGARYTAENIPGARFLGYPTGGHLAVGHETELWSEVRQFLQTAA
jgi:pimeloyl-ACP methyl ester carboxylesterase